MPPAPPPQLHFDDGSRIIIENQSSTATSNSTCTNNILTNPRGDTPIPTYYEIDRIASQIAQDIIPKVNSSENSNSDGFLCKVALQFPDELLSDSAEVAWLLDESIMTEYNNNNLNDINEVEVDGIVPVPLVFVLGDTTYASCCPDEIGAQHLNADVIVHFGQYACLSVSDTLPIIYSFGVTEWPGMDQCATTICNQFDSDCDQNEKVSGEGEKIILVCERRYHNFLEPLAELLEKKGLSYPVIGTVPASDGNPELKQTKQVQMSGCCQGQKSDSGCCDKDTDVDTDNGTESRCCDEVQQECCTRNASSECNENVTQKEASLSDIEEKSDNGCFIGGLHVSLPSSSLSEYTLLFIGDDSGQAKSRQFLNTVLKCTSPETSTKSCWSYNPSTEQLSTDPMSILGVSRYLNRRFYLTQKAQLANIIGILVGTLSQDRFRSVVASVRKKIEDSGRSSYTFVVGKVNVAKLANFAEIECFVLVACGETSILSDERDFYLPVITPTELEIALGEKEWGGAASCNTDFGDFLQGFEGDEQHDGVGKDEHDLKNDEHIEEVVEGDESSDDEPVFSMISGTYVSKPTSLKAQKKAQNASNNSNLESLPGQGQMTEYKSEAAEFWKNREYKGLEAQIGKDEAKAATKGQTGIASDYGES